MNTPHRLSAVQRTTMRAVALGAAAGLSIGGASTASASEDSRSREAATTTEAIQVVSADSVTDSDDSDL
ncbi:hypothetical protein RN607_01640 [Demequina capsici]|uniref:Uncharacterized protein n=1 Tax=Demequina capsici TaxID=3075620 RepID=A0AA96J9X1_9MICO|nr:MULTISPECIES: hypothetical protein [unclassified Demequina]WNM24825.1 hypothetical protein RN606_01365 [Demequina sp. OYTSA14]WNM27732.1 hypothetical protein RN607_01640 [Demequina sp. PMTSA13]